MPVSINNTTLTFNNGTTMTTAATGTVTSVATGNGLQGGTITSTGTLSVACPSVNTVGSYGFLIQDASTGNVNPGGTKAGNLQFSGIRSVDGSSNLDASTAASGTWRCMGYSNVNPTGQSAATVWCRVS
jgi:hypothetical protein